MQDLVIRFSYAGVFLALIARGFGFPCPEDLPLLTGGYLCAAGPCRLQWMLPLAWVGVVVADCIGYLAGRRFGHHLPRVPVLGRLVTAERLERAERFYARHGLKALVVARMAPGIRSQLFFAAGAGRVPAATFLLVDAVVAAVNVGVLVFVGWAFSAHLERVVRLTGRARWALLGVVLAIVVVVLAVRLYRDAGRRA
jgi:membrane protein DedA with SNARE-associated domain